MDLPGDRAGDLLVRLLEEVIYRMDVSGCVPVVTGITVTPTGPMALMEYGRRESGPPHETGWTGAESPEIERPATRTRRTLRTSDRVWPSVILDIGPIGCPQWLRKRHRP